MTRAMSRRLGRVEGYARMNTLGTYVGVRLLPRVARRSWFMRA